MTYLTAIDPKTTALLVIDMQEGFLSTTGGFAQVVGVESLERNQRAIIPKVRELVRMCRAAGLPILWSRQVHFPDDRTRKQRQIPGHLDKRGISVCLHGTDEVNIVDDLAGDVSADDYVFEKHRASCFYNTTLETKLRMLGTRMVIISGINSNYCVDSTVRDAYFREFDIVLVKDCVSGSFPDLHEAFLKNFDLYFGDSFTLEEMSGLLSTSSQAVA
ncbi:MAG: cysteine hydrolase family protein [Gaiellaceae bacterium]